MSLLQCSQLTRRFGALVAVDHVDLSVEAGEVRAVIGPNGAGKSTLFNIINGVLKPDSGEIVFAGEGITGLPVHRIAQLGVARTFQLTHLMPRLTVRENVRLAAQARQAGRWHLLGGSAVLARATDEADRALERLRLTPFSKSLASELSHGDQRLLEVAMALSQRPRLLMLDEPTQGLSIEETERTVDLLGQMLAEEPLTVILVEHDMEVVFKLAHKITVLHQGRVIADGVPEAVKADPQVQSAYLGGLD